MQHWVKDGSMASNNPYTSFGQTTTQAAAGSAPSGQVFETSTFGQPSRPDAHPNNIQAASATSGMTGTGTTGQGVTQPGQQHGSTMANLKAGATDIAQKTKTVAGNVWGHLNTGHPVHTAVGKLQNYRLLTPGSAQNFWRENFQPSPADVMKNYYACHLSTSTGPVAGTLFVGTQSFAFMSDRPLSYNTGPATTAWSYYKVNLPLDRVRDIIVPSGNEKYIQIDMVDGHQFWFMGFISFDRALHELKEIKSVYPQTGGASAQGGAYGSSQLQSQGQSPYTQGPPQAPPNQGPYQGQVPQRQM